MALTHEPLGKPGGPGLWGMKGAQLPAFVQHVARDLMTERGIPESQAIHMAVGLIHDWARGGHGANADTIAKAQAALAEWERLRAKAKADNAKARRTTMADGDGTEFHDSWGGDLAEIGDLAGVTIEGLEAAEAEEGGPPARMAPEEASRAYLGFAKLKGQLAAKGATNPGALAAWIGRRKYGVKKFAGLAAKARRGGGARRSAPGELLRFYPLEDIRVLTRAEGEPSGTVVEAYATVFDTQAEIHDYQGHYLETIDRTAFDQVLGWIRRNGGFPANVKVLYNHGKTMEGAPAPEFQLPLGVPEDVRPETRGLLTRTRYDASDPFTERVLGKVRSGALTSYSFVGGIMRSSPELRGPGDRYRKRDGILQTVRRMVLGLREYGPVLFPAYSGAEILGVRMQLPGSGSGPDLTEYEEYVPGMDGDGAGSVPEDTTSVARYHQHALYVLQSRELREQKGLVW